MLTYCTPPGEPAQWSPQSKLWNQDRMLYDQHFHDLFTWLKLYPWHLPWNLHLLSSSGRNDYHSTRVNNFLRVVQPAWSERFGAAHDENVWNCKRQ